MLTVTSRRGPLRDRLVFFADRDEGRALVEGVGPRDVVRIRHALGDLRSLGLRAPITETRTSRIDLTSEPDALLADMGKTCRREIRLAEKIVDRIAIDASERAAKDFLDLYNRFVAWKGYTHPMSLRRYRDYRAVSDVLVAYLDDEPFVGHVNLRDETKRRIRLVFSASNRRDDQEKRRLAGWVNRYLHWHEFLVYRERGFEAYDFGGIGDGTSSLDRFKLSFGGDVEVGQACVVSGALARLPVEAFDRVALVRRAVARVRAGLRDASTSS
jgi:lipid II:glycine glycyltransferase (peptidoglycan interpeptide bridge formation enzyme)